MSPRAELVYFDGCPHIEVARSMLRAALVLRRLPAEWCEWDVGAPETPASYRGYGSPTILIDGENVAGLPPGEGRQCVAAGAPALTQLLRALDRSLSLVGP